MSMDWLPIDLLWRGALVIVPLAVLVTVVLALGVLLGFAALIGGSLTSFTDQVPRYRARVAEAHRAMLQAVQAAGFPFIPLDDSLGTEPTLMFADECHFGDNGAKRIASRIATRLSESF